MEDLPRRDPHTGRTFQRREMGNRMVRQGQYAIVNGVEYAARVRGGGKVLHDRINFALRAADPENVHRGDGCGGAGSAANPEFQLFSRADIPKGAELWKIDPSGNRTVIATFFDKKWNLKL